MWTYNSTIRTKTNIIIGIDQNEDVKSYSIKRRYGKENMRVCYDSGIVHCNNPIDDNDGNVHGDNPIDDNDGTGWPLITSRCVYDKYRYICTVSGKSKHITKIIVISMVIIP